MSIMYYHDIMNFFPLGDKILVKKTEEKCITNSGIIIPNISKDNPTLGIVIKISKELKLHNNDVKIKTGDKVLFTKWSGIEIDLDNEKFVLIKKSDILGKIE